MKGGNAMGLDESRQRMWEILIEKGYVIETEEDWLKVEDIVRSWFADVKVEESAETFHGAFKDSRMTVRAILQERHAGHYAPEKLEHKTKGMAENKNWQYVGGGQQVLLPAIPSSKVEAGQVRTMQGIPGMKERMDSSNFFGVGAWANEKQVKGLHNVSAVLLNGKGTLKIGDSPNQMYRTSGNTTWIFMPVPREEDMLNYCLLLTLAKTPLNRSQGLKSFADYMKSRLTRIKLAFEGDAGSTFKNTAPEGELVPKVKYGFGLKLSVKSSDEVIRQRKLDALIYKTILEGGKRNEIIVAYRQHGLLAKQPSDFPVYAKGAFIKTSDPNKPIHVGFVVVGEDLLPTGKIIGLDGVMSQGTERDLSPDASILNHSPAKT